LLLSEFLELESNQFTGEIPVELYMAKLITLRLTENQLKGTIRTEIGAMTVLTAFTVGSSLMSGGIPDELYFVDTLEILDLHNASFSGPLSENGFANLTSLNRLEMQDNDFTGQIPIASILLMEDLERLQLKGNDQLSGTIPEELCLNRGTRPTELGVLTVGCNVPCFILNCDDTVLGEACYSITDGCCDDNPECPT
jgi:hypothetical protein